MGTFFLILFITIINICAWIAFFIRFKHLFSTEGLVEETRAEINRIIKDINSNTWQAVNLIDGKIRQLQTAAADIDEHIEKAKKLLKSKEFKAVEKQSLKAGIEKIESLASESRGIIQRTSSKTFDPGNRAYEVLQQGMPDLFDDLPQSNSGGNFPTSGGEVVVRNDGASYAKVPVVEMKEVEESSSNQEHEEKTDFPTKVRALNNEGKSLSEIASILGCSPVEVELVLNI